MSIVTQDIDVRYISGKSAELNFTIKASDTEESAYQDLLDSKQASIVFNGLPRKDITIEADYIDTENPANNIWRATVQYLIGFNNADNITSFDTTGGQQHVTQSLSTIGVYPPESPDMGGAVGYDGQQVNGVDIITPSYTFTEQHTFNKSRINDSFRRQLAGLTGCVNERKFRGFDEGEVLFKGATGSMMTEDSQTKWQLLFHFATSPNRFNFHVGDILVRKKMGWDYLWVIYGDEVNSNRLIKRPRSVYIERMYLFGDFSDLRI